MIKKTAVEEMQDIERQASAVKATLRFYRSKLKMLKAHGAPKDEVDDCEYHIIQNEKKLKSMTTMRRNAKQALGLMSPTSAPPESGGEFTGAPC